MMREEILAVLALATGAYAQSACSLKPENHPPLTWESCTASGCTSQSGQVVIDANWRWVHSTDGSTNCYTGNTWDASLCPDDVTCAQNCCVDGADYEGTYGITSSGNALTIDSVTGTNVGSRNYLMASDTEYQEFQLLGNEFTFDVDVSALGCGLNGALYFVSMAADGGTSQYSGNTAGAQYGTGYCDSQCPRDLKFINGQGNVEGWVPSSDNANTGVGNHGSCCSEMDIREANSISEALTPHPCQTVGQLMCDGDDCGGTYSANRYAGECDPDGCDWNPYRLGNETFFGPGSSFTIDTTQPFTVVTQFAESGGAVSSIDRYYVQNGVKYEQPNADNIPGFSGNSITEAYCNAEGSYFNESSFNNQGGLAQMSKALAGNMVLVMSLWDDYAADMLWLDSNYPTNSTSPGALRGSCSTSSGVPSQVESQQGSSKVVFSNIRFGPIGSTNPLSPNNPSPAPTTTSTPGPTSTASPSGAQQSLYGQCGGQSWSGPTTCQPPATCQEQSEYYSKCLD